MVPRPSGGSVFCCLLALKLSREIERRLQAAFATADSDPHAVTLPGALAALSRLCLLNYTVDDTTSFTRLPRPDPRQTEILKALGVTLPGKLRANHRLKARGRSAGSEKRGTPG